MKARSKPCATRVFLLSLLALASGSQSAIAHPRTDLGSYELEALETALARRSLVIHLEPNGKSIDQIHVVNLEVFGEDTGSLRSLNRLHYTTEEYAIRRELLMEPGELWDPVRVSETERILRNPSLSSIVVVVPVQSQQEGMVDMLVVTRDVWSLRSNSEFIHQGSTLTFLKVAAAENNILGRRKHLSFILEMDQGAYSLSTRWRDLNVLGKRWQLVFRPHIIFGRASDDFEGTESFTRIEYPLWSLASEWGLALEATHKSAISRNFEGDKLATYDSPSTPEVENTPQEFRQNDVALRSQVTRSFGQAFKYRVSVGHEFLSTRPSLLPSFTLTSPGADDFARALFPRNEQSSALTLGLEFFQPRFVTYRNLNGYDLPEIKRAGPSLEAEAALALKQFGSERGFARSALRAGYLFDFDTEAIIEVGLSLGRRVEKRSGSLDSVDTTYGADWFVGTPVARFHRLVSYGEVRLRADVLDNQLVRLGGQDDLRGFPVGQFIGTSFYKGSVELRSMPRKFYFLRVGYLAFYDLGGAANRLSSLGLHQDVGLGLKALVPQTGQSLMFLYWAVPLDPEARSFPGRISLGFGAEI